MPRWYVDIAHMDDEALAILGYTFVGQDDEFKLYRDYAGDEYLVSKDGPQFLMVTDVNDAIIMRSERVLEAPTQDP